jgi:acetyl esterase/lipase
MRDHGGTFHGQWWLPSTLGVLEGHDLVGAARYVARIRPPGPTAITRFGVVGYSAGGLFALRGAIQDRGRLFSEGVLAISPILDLRETLTRMGKIGTCCAFDLACISQRAMAYYFMDLLKTRMLGLELEAGKKDVTAIAPADYARERILPFPAYAGLPDARDLVTPERLADDLRAAVPAPSAPPSVAVLTSHDDPVVGDRAAMTVRSRLAGDPAVGVYVPRRGGHIAFSVLSPAVTRAFLRGFFDGVPCPPGA